MPRWLPFAHTPLKASFSVKAELFTRKVSYPAGFRRLNQMAAGFHRFSGDGNLINFIAILRINIPCPPRAEAAVGLLRGGGILGFGFMNIAGDPVGHLRAAGTFAVPGISR